MDKRLDVLLPHILVDEVGAWLDKNRDRTVDDLVAIALAHYLRCQGVVKP